MRARCSHRSPIPPVVFQQRRVLIWPDNELNLFNANGGKLPTPQWAFETKPTCFLVRGLEVFAKETYQSPTGGAERIVVLPGAENDISARTFIPPSFATEGVKAYAQLEAQSVAVNKPTLLIGCYSMASLGRWGRQDSYKVKPPIPTRKEFHDYVNQKQWGPPFASYKTGSN